MAKILKILAFGALALSEGFVPKQPFGGKIKKSGLAKPLKVISSDDLRNSNNTNDNYFYASEDGFIQESLKSYDDNNKTEALPSRDELKNITSFLLDNPNVVNPLNETNDPLTLELKRRYEEWKDQNTNNTKKTPDTKSNDQESNISKEFDDAINDPQFGEYFIWVVKVILKNSLKNNTILTDGIITEYKNTTSWN